MKDNQIKQQMADLKQKWLALDPLKRRIIMAGIVFGLIVIAAIVLGNQRNAESLKKAQDKVIPEDEVVSTNLVTPKVGEIGIDDLKGQTQAELDRQRQQQEAMLQSQQRITQDVTSGNAQVGEQMSDLARQLATVTDEVKSLKLGSDSTNQIPLPALQGVDPAIPDPNAKNPSNPAGAMPSMPDTNSQPLPATNPLDNSGSPDDAIGPTRPSASDPFQIIRSGRDAASIPSNGYRPSGTAKQSAEPVAVQAKLLLEHGLPTGSILEGVLINGMDAPAMSKGKSGAVPALIRIKKNAILPNRYSQMVKECFVLVSGVGNLASERAEMRGEKISCIFKDGTVIDTAVSAYIVGEDGKNGLRGRVVSKQGAAIARSIWAGTLSGLGKAYTPQSVPSINVSGGGETEYQTPKLGTALQSGAMGGVSSSLDRVANFYLDLADQMMPVIEIDAGRQVTLILTNTLKGSANK